MAEGEEKGMEGKEKQKAKGKKVNSGKCVNFSCRFLRDYSISFPSITGVLWRLIRIKSVFGRGSTPDPAGGRGLHPYVKSGLRA